MVYDTSGGGSVKKHNHVSELSGIKAFGDLAKYFALVYYVNVGDQNCNEPGYLKFYDPEEQILPTEGMVIIFQQKDIIPYAVGTKERIIIGLNFLSI